MDRHRPQVFFDISRERKVGIEPVETGVVPNDLVPTEEMRRARLWLEKIEEPPLPDKELLSVHGWLSPEGELYACGWERHDELTKALGYRHESDIEEAGFCKLSRLTWLVQPRYCKSGLTESQWETIERWYDRNGFCESHYLRLAASV